MKFRPSFSVTLLALAASVSSLQAQLLITEINSDGSGGDFWELTNVGTSSVDLGNYKWNDSARATTGSAVTIPSGTSIAAGESILFNVTGNAAIFRTAWGVNSSVQVVSGGPGLGMNDAITLFNAAGTEVLYLSYAASGFTRSSGSGAAGGHAGSSAGGVSTVSMVLDPGFATTTPRYSAAVAGTFGAFAHPTVPATIGSPGVSGLNVAPPSVTLSLGATNSSFSESAANPASVGTVTRTGATTSALVVTLSSSDATEATVPASVTIPIGSASASFDITAVNDNFPDGNKTAIITASATGATAGTTTLTVNDDGDVYVQRLLLTEVLSQQAAAGVNDFWELTNISAVPVSLEGYSWHDNGRSALLAQAYKLPAGASIAPGESVIFCNLAPAAFRTWWNIPNSVQVFQSTGAPGLGQNDGVSFFDEGQNEIFFFNYAAAGFTKSDGNPSTGTHSGPSAGASTETQSAVWDPASGTASPRYTFATVNNLGAFASAASALDIGSPGVTVGVPSVSIASAAAAEGNSGTSTLTLNVTRTDVSSAFSVDYSVSGGTATSGTDFTLASGTLNFTAAGVASLPIDITVNGDTTTESNETVIVTLSNLVNLTGTTVLGTAVGTATLTNDDVVLPTFTTAPVSTSITSGGVATLTLVAGGSPAPTIQWYQGISGDTSSPVGTNSPIFTTPALNATTQYWARISNTGGPVDSSTITVTVASGATAVDLSTYVRVGRFGLPEPTRTALPAGTASHNLLCQEASAVTYNWDTDTLFIGCDGGRSITQVSKTGQLIDTMSLDLQAGAPQGTAFYDIEGITYIGGGQFVMSEERDQQLVKFTYVAGTTLTRANSQTVDLGPFDDNTGTEGLSWDPPASNFICLKEKNPIGVFRTGVNFAAGTATTAPPSVGNEASNLFNTSLLGMTDVADVFAFSNIPSMVGQPQADNLLIVGQENARIVNISRSGSILSTLNLTADAGDTINVADMQHEGITMDRVGNIYVVNENGGGNINFPELWVYSASSATNLAPSSVAINNPLNSIQENSSTASPVKVGDIVVTDDGLGSNTLSLTGADAASFEITGSSLFLKAGVTLDFETKTSYAVTINADDTTLGATPDTTVNFTLTVTDQVVETPAPPALIVTEVAPWSSGNSPVILADWFEVTNVSASPVDITGWKVDDSSALFTSALTLNGITTIAPGESVIFLESSATNLPATVIANFKSVWFGASPPVGLQIGTYQGGGIGLGTGGDAVNLYNASGVRHSGVSFGASDAVSPYQTFDNTAAVNNAVLSLLSATGVNGAFVATNTTEIGSPGYSAPGVLRVTEIAPWSSGNSPVAADWFEVTNTGARAVDLTGWKFDDSSESPAAALPLTGITSIAPGESVIFIETSATQTASGNAAAFRSNWFGTTPPVALQVGAYTGGGAGLSTGGDAVNLFDSNNVRQANVSFGIATSAAPYRTFDNAAAANVASITTFSTAGINGALVAVNSSTEIGSPGTLVSAPIGASSVSISSAAVNEGNSGTTTLNLPVTRTNTASIFTVAYAVTGGTATSGSDFTLASGTLTFGFNSAATQDIAITLTGDTTFEFDETITVTLSNVINSNGTTTIGTAVGTGTITNDDAPTFSTPLSSANRDVTLANIDTWPAAGVNVGGTQFVNLGLQGVGRLPASSVDPATGETLGSISDMQISNWVKNPDGSFSGTLNTLPDRGYNSTTIFSNYAARINDFAFTFTPYTGTTAITAQNQIALSFTGSTRFTYDHDANSATPPVFTTGLVADGAVSLFGTTVPVRQGATTQSDGTVNNRLTVDAEGLILDKRPGKGGAGWVGDEYGAYIYHFNASKQIDGQLLLPAALLPHATAGGPVSFNATPVNIDGRRINQGMEGLAQNPAGTKLFGLMQSATMQDSTNAQQTRLNTRLVVYDVSTSDTPSAPSAQYVIQLPRIDDNGGTVAVNRTGAQSSIIALNDHQLLILSRDGSGRGASGSPVFKSILLADLTGATNINGLFDAAGSAVAPAGVLNATVTPLSWTEALNMIGKLDLPIAEVAKFGLNLNTAPGDINSISEKWEALSLVSANDPANPNDYFLFIGNDNDFITQTGVYKDDTGALQNYNAGLENDTVILAYRVRMAGSENQVPFATNAIPAQPATKGSAFSYTLPVNAFTDPEGQPLTLTATRADDSALPAWLTFNPATGTFSGSPTAVDIGNLVVKVTATDNGSPALSYSTNFTIPVASLSASSYFPQSVASGDPRSNSVILWTRLLDGDTAMNRSVTLHMSTTGTLAGVGTTAALGGANVWTGGALTAQSAHDGVVKVKVGSLAADTTYYYQFSYNGQRSPIGRTKTAPAAGSTRTVKYAAINCNDFVGRYFNVLRQLAEREQNTIDFVLNLGDYVYETTGDPSFQTSLPERAMVFSNPTEAINLGSGNFAAQSIGNYRDIYKTIRQDAQLQRVHELFPMISIWDDHEFSDDNWKDNATYFDGKVNEQQTSRKRNGEQAWMEFLPTERGMATTGNSLEIDSTDLYPNTVIYDAFNFGTNLDLILTDIRTNRADHLIPEEACPSGIPMTESDLIATLAAANGLSVPVFTAAAWPGIRGSFAPYVNIDDPAYAAVKGVFKAIIASSVNSAMATLPAGQTPVTTGTAYADANVVGFRDASFINQAFAAAGQSAPFDAAALAAMPRGLSYYLLGKTSVFSDSGSRYQVVNPTFQLFAGYTYQAFVLSNGALGRDQAFYNTAQRTFLATALANSTAAGNKWRVIASSTPYTPIKFELGDLPAGITLPTQGTISGQTIPAGLPAQFLVEFLLNADEPAGFPQFRQGMIDLFAQHDAIIVSGDIHAGLIGKNNASNGQKVVDFTVPSAASSEFRRAISGAFTAVEGLMTPGVRQATGLSGSFAFDTAQKQAVVDATDAIIKHNTPEMLQADTATHGYTVFTAGQSAFNADYQKISVSEIDDNLYSLTPAALNNKFTTQSFAVGKTGAGAATDLSISEVDYTLQVLHLADGEAGLLAPTTAPNLAALVDAFDGTYANTLILAGGDNWIPGPFASAGTDVSVRDELNAATGSTMSLAASANHPIAALDIGIHNVIGVEVSAIGNHEFDLGSRVFRDSFSPALGLAGWAGANFPHISANLDFSGDGDLNPRFSNTLDGGTATLIPEASTLKGRIAPSTVITKGGEKIGIVGATTQIIESISSPSGTEVKGFPTGAGANGEVDNMPLLASQLQPVINELIAEGVDKIILMAHLQVIANEQALAPLLTGVDIILSAGSNTRLGDANDVPVAFPGHSANFANAYPILTAGADGKPTLIINTDNEYTYLGRLVADFDANGVLITPNLAGNSIINGAYAATAANVATAWATTEANLATTAFAAGTKGNKVASLTGAVQSVIAAKDGNIAGYTDVYLQGERIAVRNQETNLGNLSADANLTVLRQALGTASATTHTVSLKNGGGIRAQIGTISSPDPVTGLVTTLPPAANLAVGKQVGAVSQLDIENSLRFNNLLMAFDTTPAGLKAIVEHGVALLVNQGRYPQIGGMRFSYDSSLAVGSRVRSLVLIDESDIITARIIEDGVVLTDAPASITMVTLSFLAQGGDGYPMKANGDNFRFLLTNGSLGGTLVETLDFGVAANIPSNALGEQTALFNHLNVRHPAAASAFKVAETDIPLDTRIQQKAFRLDTVLDGPAALGTWLKDNGLTNVTLDTDNDSLTDLQEFAFGLDPRASDNAPVVTDVPGGVLTTRGTPAIYTAPTTSGQDFRVVFIRQKSAAASGVTYIPQFSSDMITWETSNAIPTTIASDTEVEAVSIRYPFFVNGKKARFFRVGVSQN